MDPITTWWFAECLRRVDEEEHNWIEDVLGTRWTREYFEYLAGGGTDGTRPDVVRVPLTMALAQIDFLKEVKKMIGFAGADMPGSLPTELKDSVVEEIGHWPKEDFLALIGGAGLLPPNKKPQKKK